MKNAVKSSIKPSLGCGEWAEGRCCTDNQVVQLLLALKHFNLSVCPESLFTNCHMWLFGGWLSHIRFIEFSRPSSLYLQKQYTGVDYTSSCHLCHLPLQRATYTQHALLSRTPTSLALLHMAIETVGIDTFFSPSDRPIASLLGGRTHTPAASVSVSQ